jgi:hypothetical protein
MKSVYIICPVTIADDKDKNNLNAYVSFLEDDGYRVYYPGRDTDQKESGFDICLQNGAAIQEADEVHVFYKSSSKGSHFDLGVAFAFDILQLSGNKKKFKLVDVNINDKGNGPEFVSMMKKWEELRND